jgi:hypothetical protein
MHNSSPEEDMPSSESPQMVVPQPFQQGHAVVVGVGQDLPVTADDAAAIAGILRDPARCAYPDAQVCLLTGPQARREPLLAAIEWLAKHAGEQDTALVYFSGHGMQTPEYYLMPFGYDLADLPGTAIPGDLFTEHLKAIRASKLVVLLDCCHAGGQADVKGALRSPLPASVLENLGQGSGRVIIASSRKDEVSYAGEPHSVFTAALLEALAGYGAFEQDGYARILDLAMWVGRKVPERTRDRQHPIIKVSNLEDNFALAWYAGGEKSPRPLAGSAPGLPGLGGSLDTSHDLSSLASWKRMLANYRENLLLIEERMSEYVEFNEIPLQLVKNKRQTEARIIEIEKKLGLVG